MTRAQRRRRRTGARLACVVFGLAGLGDAAAMLSARDAISSPPPQAVPRDPFMPPSPPPRPAPPAPRPRPVEAHLAEVALDEAVVAGTACSAVDAIAVIRSASRRSWVAAAGDRLRDARVVRVACGAVLFERDARRGRPAEELWRRLPPRDAEDPEE